MSEMLDPSEPPPVEQTLPSKEDSTGATDPAPKRHRRPVEWLKSEFAIVRGSQADKWAHRRGEPRNFAFLWAIYLMLGSIIALGVVLAGGIVTLDAYQPLSRGLVVTLAVGVMIFWPLIRLSQIAPPEGSRTAAMKDLAIVLIPLQAVIWPQMVLARWTPNIVLATSMAMIAWGVLVAGLIALGTRSNQTWRSAWMATIVCLVIGGAAISMLAGQVLPDLLRPIHPDAAPALVLASGAGLVADISADRSWSGSWALAMPEHWRAIWCTFGAGLVVWILAAIIIRSKKAVAEVRMQTAGPEHISRLDSVADQGGELVADPGIENGQSQLGLPSEGTVGKASDPASNGN